MKKITKIIGAQLLLTVLCVLALITVVEIATDRSHRQVTATVAALPPGTPFSVALQRLGPPKAAYTNAEEIVSWLARMESRVDPGIATNSVLHTFVHRGPPFRYILVFTDHEGARVVYTDWCHM